MATDDLTIGTVIDTYKATQTSMVNSLYQASSAYSHRESAMGIKRSPQAMFLSRFDRFGVKILPTNNVLAGLTFITRPRLCLASANLKQDRVMSVLNTMDNSRYEFSIRAYLDSKFAQSSRYLTQVKNCPWVNSSSPFILPLMNGLRNVTGFPDFYVDTLTSQGGFYGEDQTIASGSDFNARSYDLSLEFQDIQGGYVLAMLLCWIRYMALVRRNVMVAYQDDILAQRLNYTCSIYRFILDPSRNTIVNWAKATGCFPKSLPIGSMFDINDREHFVHAAQSFTVPFQVNTMEYMDPIILQEFNVLMARWGGNPMTLASNGQLVPSLTTPRNNFTGVPFINLADGVNQLNFYADPKELEDPSDSTLQQVSDNMAALKAAVVAADQAAGFTETVAQTSGLISL